MQKVKIHLILILCLFYYLLVPPRLCTADTFISLVYHNVGAALSGDKFAVRTVDLVEQFEYLATHGYNPVSMEQIIRSHNTGKRLPEKAVLITVDDGLESFYTKIFPLLKIYNFPAVLSVVASWVENGMPGISNDKNSQYKGVKVMTWEQIKEVSDSGLVEIASHSYDLHKGIPFNPQGNTFAAGSSFAYFPETQRYETEELFKKRIQTDLKQAVRIMKKKIGITPRVMVWPYGELNQLGVEAAKSAGMKFNFSVMDGVNDTKSIDIVRRGIVTGISGFSTFVLDLRRGFVPKDPRRAIQVDLDLIYDEDGHQQEKNLGKLLERIAEAGVNTVFLQAFSDIDGDGNASSLYFPNHTLPTRSDLFNRAAHQIKTRTEVEDVYAWLPLLSFDLLSERSRLLVREKRDGYIEVSKEGYRRLSPFSPKTLEIVTAIYKDLAKNTNLSGVLFQDDAYLTDFEDFHPEAAAAFKRSFNLDLNYENIRSTPGMVKKWTELKTETLIEFSKKIMESVLFYRPAARFLRNIYAPLLTNPDSEEWFAQNYQKFLKSYDYVVVMAYPSMEKQASPEKWLKNLTNIAATYKQGVQKTFFKIQSFDWRKNKWIRSKMFLDQVYALITSGARHIAYYPDNLHSNQPPIETIKRGFSMGYSPFYP